MDNAKPLETFLANYKPPAYLVSSVDLTFDILEDQTTVTCDLMAHQNPNYLSKTSSFCLDGEELELVSLAIDGKPVAEDQYEISDKQLKIDKVPSTFSLRTEVKIDPSKNSKLEGLYSSKTGLFTQCEAEGFRRITYFPDRPDVMSLYTTTAPPDLCCLATYRKKYPPPKRL